MSELKLPRLLAAAKEFNVGQDTIIDFLAKKGFPKEELKPSAKLTEKMYMALQAEFLKDKQTKTKADLVEIPRGVQHERKRKDEEEIHFRRSDGRNTAALKEEVPAPESIQVPEIAKPSVKWPDFDTKDTAVKPIAVEMSEPTSQPVPDRKEEEETAKVETVKPEAAKIETAPSIQDVAIEYVPKPSIEPVAEQPKPTDTSSAIIEAQPIVALDPIERPVQAETPTEEPKEPVDPMESGLEIEPEAKASTAAEPPAITKINAPGIEGPKIQGKIDLSALDFSTRPKKGAPQKFEPQKQHATLPQRPQPMAQKPVETPRKPSVEKLEEPQDAIPVEEIKATPIPEPNKVVEPIAEPPTPFDAEGPAIENIQAEKITGPKILGKISLPTDNDTRPKQLSLDDKKKRKRIPIDSRKVTGPGPNTGTNAGQQQGGNKPATQQGPQQPTVPKQGGQGFTKIGNSITFNREGRMGTNSNSNLNRPSQNNRQQNAGGSGNNRNNAGNKRGEDKEIDAKEIQDKIKETQAKLSGGSGRGKGLKAKYKRARREEAAVARGAQGEDGNKLQVTEFVTVSELANLMDVSFTDIISKCMGLGIMASINQRLDAEVIELVANEFDFEVEFIGLEDVEEEEEDTSDEPEVLESRPPIVTIMGHVDHGKTSLLDYIRRENVVAGEAGGITQHIGAYEVTLPDGKAITFLDTPGHEAFTAMRARGAKVTDIAVIVVAADDAVMPQTREAISHAQAANVPMIFAVNKIDKDGANPTKIYEQLANMNLLVESWGGKYQSQELSAKKGLGVDELLEKILLEAELLELKANPKKESSGSIIEASLDKGRGYVATILVQNGTLKQGDLIVSGQFYGRVKAMFNERNARVQVAPPSTPVVILGLNGAPQAGEKFKVYTDESEAKDVATKRAQISREQGLRARKHLTLEEIGRRLALGNFKELNIIIKGDVDGSVEALSDSLQKLSNQEIAVRVVHKAVGQISESDILLAAASDAIIVGFNVRPSSQANKLAQNEGVQVKLYSIIYTAIDEIKGAMEGMLEPKVQEKEVATIEVREVFKFDKITVAGCYVTEGKVKRDQKIKVYRDGILVYPRQEGGYAELGSLKRFKDDVKEVNFGFECGLTIKGFSELNIGDTIVSYEEEEVKRTL